MYRATTTYTSNHDRINKSEIGGIKNTYGVPPINAAVHFITATPILIFFPFKIAQHRKNKQNPAATQAP